MRDNAQKDYIYGETFSPEAPRPTVAVYEILAQYLKAGGNDTEAHEVLNDVYKALGDSEQEVSLALYSLEGKGAISREDSLMIIVLLSVSRTLGPDLNFLRQAITNGNFDSSEINLAISTVNLDGNISDYLQKVFLKLKR